MKRFLVFDTETTGLPKNYKASHTDTANWPRIIQIAWAIVERDGTTVKERCSLIKPDGWHVPDYDYWKSTGLSDSRAKIESKFWTENGYSHLKSIAEGVPLKPVLEEFSEDLAICDYVVAHNMSYDLPITACEMYRYGVVPKKKVPKICTKEASTDYCAIPSPYKRGKFKWPNLTELHTKLFNEGFEGAHDAMDDVRACSRSLIELIARGIIKITD